VVAYEKLHERLGVPTFLDHRLGHIGRRFLGLLVARPSLSIRAIIYKIRRLGTSLMRYSIFAILHNDF
jgi:hypothetical protein